MNAGLLGPNGQPMEKYLEHAGRPKNPKPVVGDAFADWGGMSRDFIHLPGGGVIGFDTSKLGIKDFRRMREHYQIGSSLHVLTFMLHQLDWRVECDDPKVAAWCTVNLEAIWTRLVRAMSTAFAFGFSANAVEWENDSNEGKLRLNKIKDLVPEECEVSWKYVDSAIKPNGNVAAPKVPIFDGISKRGTSYKIPVENSLWYPLLMENGDYRGRQLLRAAFQPWFFSTLIHLYQNKYFERFGEPVPIGRAPYNDKVTKDGKTVYGYDLMATILSNIRSRSAVVLPNSRSKEGMNDQPEYDYQVEYLECVDTETEILTRRGWKRYNEVSVGDEVMTLNNDLGVSEWQPIQKMNVHEAKDRTMLSMEGASHSSLTTENHRWPTRYTTSQVKGGKKFTSDYRRFRHSSDLTLGDRIPLCAPPVDLPTEQKYTDAFVQLVAWFWTEGWINQKTKNYGTITQRRHPEMIRAVLKSLYGDPVEKFDRNNYAIKSPQWRESSKWTENSGEEIREFHLNHTIMQELKGVMDTNKIVSYEFLNSLTESQLAAYIRTSLVYADGNHTVRQDSLMQKSREAAERFQYACTLYGIATTLHHQKPDARFPNDTGMWVVSIRRKEYFNPRQASQSHRGGRFKSEWVDYSGIVWCPTTANATWLARRNGTVYFTGNSQMRGADFERYLTRLDEEMSLALFTPLLLLRTADAGGFNQGVAHTQVYLWMLNAVAGDMAEYIDKYVLRYMAIYNFGPKAKLPRIRFRKLGTAQQETLRAIVQAMIGKNQVKPDVTELGQHIGLTLEEVEEVTEPGPDPDAADEDDEEIGDNGNKDGRVGRPERLKDQDGIKPGSTTKQISARIAEQIKRAYKRNDLLDWKPAPGFHRQLTGELQAMGHMDARRAASVFNDTVIGVLSESAKLDWSSAEEFIAYAEGIINAEGEKLYASA
ncbi:portal protein [Gordonia phage Lahirium]|uniref:Portal protein n=2 Tax=Woesvirus woes TaxID=1982751 RepID=A0A482JAK8_9CAUD|nr:portal protein [Gordonia phage Hail2Pitt]QBP30583.1 portal protein [Gordonia phage Lahirium]